MNISSKMTGLALVGGIHGFRQNLLVNSDFESGIDSWITFNNVEVSRISRLTAPPPPNCSTRSVVQTGVVRCEQSTSCVPGQGYDGSIMTYVSSGDAFSAGSGNFLVLQVAFDGAGNFLSSVKAARSISILLWTPGRNGDLRHCSRQRGDREIGRGVCLTER